MKRLFCALLAVLILCGCGGPALRAGYYLLPLEESEGMPFYFSLEPDGTGFVHAMGQDVPITWTPAGLGGDFADGTVTAGGLEFAAGEGKLVLTWSRELPEEYSNDLPPEHYIANMED